MWFAHDGTSLPAILAYWSGLGTVIGALVAVLGYALNGGRRNFADLGNAGPTLRRARRWAFADEAIRRLTGTGTPS